MGPSQAPLGTSLDPRWGYSQSSVAWLLCLTTLSVRSNYTIIPGTVHSYTTYFQAYLDHSFRFDIKEYYN